MTRAKDTEWSRYQVFLQEREGEPHQDVGSVHGPDAEMALQNARDVFTRRPECISLWVVPAAAIFSKTRQELEEWQAPQEPDGEPETYYVSWKQKSTGTQVVIGTVNATTPEVALQQALERFSGTQPPFVWWVFPERMITATAQDEVDSLFDPALDKPFRLSKDFKTVTVMRELKQPKLNDQ